MRPAAKGAIEVPTHVGEGDGCITLFEEVERRIISVVVDVEKVERLA